MKISEMDDHCGECKLIDWCDKSYEYPYLCSDTRFVDIEVETYIQYAKESKCKNKKAIANDVHKKVRDRDGKTDIVQHCNG